MLKGEFLEKVLRGEKRATIRRKTRVKKGDTILLHSKGKIWGEAVVEDVYTIKKSEIGEKETQLEGMNIEELRKTLDRLYGKKDVPLTVVVFRLTKVYDEPLDTERVYDIPPGKIADLCLKRGMDSEVLRLLRRTGSIRKTALLLGSLRKRGYVRRVLRECYQRLKEEGVI